MLNILFYLFFIFSVAIAAGSIILSARLRSNFKFDFFSSLLYYEVFILTFGFYGLWGQVMINAFLAPYISPDLFTRVSNIALLMGLPFLIFAWLMLIQFSSAVSGRKYSGLFTNWFLFINFSLLITLGYFIAKKNTTEPASLIRNYFMLMNLLYAFYASYLIHLPRHDRTVISEYDRRIIAPVLFILMTAQCILLWFYNSEPWLALLFITTFFGGNLFLPVYFTYGSFLPAHGEQAQKNTSFEEFIRKYEISPRESEIINEICNGLSNKEISEKLFISLQTVKDHTHRIYIKTNVKSRVQLINLVKDGDFVRT
jgi:DNA-binding CsgD family transcriptional regulator